MKRTFPVNRVKFVRGAALLLFAGFTGGCGTMFSPAGTTSQLAVKAPAESSDTMPRVSRSKRSAGRQSEEEPDLATAHEALVGRYAELSKQLEAMRQSLQAISGELAALRESDLELRNDINGKLALLADRAVLMTNNWPNKIRISLPIKIDGNKSSVLIMPRSRAEVGRFPPRQAGLQIIDMTEQNFEVINCGMVDATRELMIVIGSTPSSAKKAYFIVDGNSIEFQMPPDISSAEEQRAIMDRVWALRSLPKPGQ